jgi:hypothetical protein
MLHSPSWQTNRFSASQDIPRFTRFTTARHQAVTPGRGPLWTARNKVLLLRWGGFSTSWNPKLEDHPLSAVRNCLFNIFAATLHTGGRSSIRNLMARHFLVTGTHLSWPALSTPFLNSDSERSRVLVNYVSCLRRIPEDNNFNNYCPKDVIAVPQVRYICTTERRVQSLMEPFEKRINPLALELDI